MSDQPVGDGGRKEPMTTTPPSRVRRRVATLAAAVALVGGVAVVGPCDTTGTPPHPTAATTGVTGGVTLKPWKAAFRTSAATLPTEKVGDLTCKLIEGYLIDLGQSNHLDVDQPCVILRDSKVLIHGDVDNTSAMVQGRGDILIVQTSEFDGGPRFMRGIQSDDGDIVVNRSRFHNTGEAAIEKNDRQGDSSLDVRNSYFTDDKRWPRGQHMDGIQIGGADNVTIINNTILNEPFGGTEGDTSYVSNSALGLWAELGNVNGAVLVQGNLLAGGGRTIYIEQKAPFAWKGPVKIIDNTFDLRFGPNAAVWGPLYPKGLPADLTWVGNQFSDGRVLLLSSALHDYP